MDNITRANKTLNSWKKVPTLNDEFINDMVVTGDHVTILSESKQGQLLSAKSNEILRQLCPRIKKTGEASTYSSLATWNLYKVGQKFGSSAVLNKEIDGLRRRGIKDDPTIMDYANKQMAAMITILTE
jgi:hypothetical protein